MLNAIFFLLALFLIYSGWMFSGFFLCLILYLHAEINAGFRMDEERRRREAECNERWRTLHFSPEELGEDKKRIENLLIEQARAKQEAIEAEKARELEEYRDKIYEFEKFLGMH